VLAFSFYLFEWNIATAGVFGEGSDARYGYGGGLEWTYSPPVTLLVPKLLPTAPVQRHVFPAAFFQVAVAVAPTLRHDTERFERGGESMGEAEVSATAAVRSVKRVDFIMNDSIKKGNSIEEVEWIFVGVGYDAGGSRAFSCHWYTLTMS
jgi:hypothetical protein